MRIAAFYAHPIPRAIPSATAAARRALLPCQCQRQRHIPRRPGRRDLCSAASWPRGVCAATTTAGHIRPALPSPPGGSFTSPSTLPLASLLRGMATATATTTTASEPKFSAGSDEVALRRALETLLLPGSGAGGGGGRWALVAGGEGLERSFRFKTFAKTWVSYVYPFGFPLVQPGLLHPGRRPIYLLTRNARSTIWFKCGLVWFHLPTPHLTPHALSLARWVAFGPLRTILRTAVFQVFCMPDYGCPPGWKYVARLDRRGDVLRTMAIITLG